ncbi:hypothetical protein CTZ27_22380 [Streptomyces griseocarneus]|nr:hypothetical protein CTZ27_22380 [Streptomyces griseocarneus]
MVAALLPAAALAGGRRRCHGRVPAAGRGRGGSLRRALWLAHEQLTGGPLWAVLLAVFIARPFLVRVWPRLWGWREEAEHGEVFSARAYTAAALVPVLALVTGLIPVIAPPLP